MEKPGLGEFSIIKKLYRKIVQMNIIELLKNVI